MKQSKTGKIMEAIAKVEAADKILKYIQTPVFSR